MNILPCTFPVMLALAFMVGFLTAALARRG